MLFSPWKKPTDRAVDICGKVLFCFVFLATPEPVSSFSRLAG